MDQMFKVDENANNLEKRYIVSTKVRDNKGIWLDWEVIYEGGSYAIVAELIRRAVYTIT